MRAMAAEALRAGAIGISTGLAYEPARASTTEEVIDVCGPLKDHNGVYCTHLRDEGDDIVQAMEEAFRIGREVGVPIVLSHHKLTGSNNFGRSHETLALIEKRMREQDVGLDCYPHCAASTVLSWERARVSSKTLVTWSKPHPEHAGAPHERGLQQTRGDRPPDLLGEHRERQQRGRAADRVGHVPGGPLARRRELVAQLRPPHLDDVVQHRVHVSSSARAARGRAGR